MTAILAACSTSPTPEELAAGQRLYRVNGCALCHGLEGRGDGRDAATLDVPPRDFRDEAAFRQGHSVEAIEQTIVTGVVDEDGSPMPSFPDISEEDRRLIAHFVMSLVEDPRPPGP
jgi:mono/diheme cytochrome c family protein